MLWAVVGLLAVATLASGFTAFACGYVIDSFQNSNTMALLITDAGLKSDDKNLEANLTTATLTLHYLRDIGSAVVIGSLGVGLAIGFRLWRNRAQG